LGGEEGQQRMGIVGGRRPSPNKSPYGA